MAAGWPRHQDRRHRHAGRGWPGAPAPKRDRRRPCFIAPATAVQPGSAVRRDDLRERTGLNRRERDRARSRRAGAPDPSRHGEDPDAPGRIRPLDGRGGQGQHVLQDRGDGGGPECQPADPLRVFHGARARHDGDLAARPHGSWSEHHRGSHGDAPLRDPTHGAAAPHLYTSDLDLRPSPRATSRTISQATGSRTSIEETAAIVGSIWLRMSSHILVLEHHAEIERAQRPPSCPRINPALPFLVALPSPVPPAGFFLIDHAEKEVVHMLTSTRPWLSRLAYRVGPSMRRLVAMGPLVSIVSWATSGWGATFTDR